MDKKTKSDLLVELDEHIMKDPSFAKEVVDHVAFALQQRVSKAEELAHQKDLALLSALTLLNLKNNNGKVSKAMMQHFENDLVVHGILCSSDYREIEQRLQNLCEAERRFIQHVVENHVGGGK